MEANITAGEARAALDAVDRNRRRVIDEIALPQWYWWGLALGWIALGLITDLKHAWVTAAATLVFGAAQAAVASRVASGRHRTQRVSVRAEVAGHQTALLVFAGLVALACLTIAGSLAVSADGARHPVTIASTFVAVMIVLGGPRLPASVRRAREADRHAMSSARFDELIHPSTRLSLVALLAAADWAEFGFLRDELGLSDSALSKQLSVLEEAGYVHIDRPLRDRRRRVRARLTEAGAAAFQGHVAALRAIVAGADPEHSFV